MRRATVVTPNLPEARSLTGLDDEPEALARAVHELGPDAVVVTGGHREQAIDVFFDVRWAYWLRDTIPGTRTVIELDGAKLFFPEERPDALAAALRAHWQATAGVVAAPA